MISSNTPRLATLPIEWENTQQSDLATNQLVGPKRKSSVTIKTFVPTTQCADVHCRPIYPWPIY